MLIIFQLIVLVFSVVVHEVSHGVIALALGDQTAKRAGRLTLNPLKHLDPFGSVIVPLLLLTLSFFSGGKGIIFGWAKPVPYNPANLRDPKRGSGLIAAVGPLSNVLVALIFGMLVRLMMLFPLEGIVPALILFFNIVVQINLVLAVFNMLPIPPLDGSGILFSLIPPSLYKFEAFLRRYGVFMLLLFVFYGFGFLAPAVFQLHLLFAGPSAVVAWQ